MLDNPRPDNNAVCKSNPQPLSSTRKETESSLTLKCISNSVARPCFTALRVNSWVAAMSNCLTHPLISSSCPDNILKSSSTAQISK